MTIAGYLAAFAASFCYVGLRSWQQINVTKKKYHWILPTSFFMASVEVVLIQQMAHNAWGWIVLFIGAGGGIGSCTATYLHSRLHK